MVESLALSAEKLLFVLPRGGTEFEQPITAVDENSLEKLSHCAERWPEENGETVQVLLNSLQQQPFLNHFVASETAYFKTLPASLRNYALPKAERELGYWRYGADGLHHAWVAQHHSSMHRLISVHLCENTTLAAIQEGSALDCSSGYSRLEGLPGLTTCGDIDPSLVGLYNEKGLAPEEIRRQLYTQSGWQALAPGMNFAKLCNVVEDDCRLPQSMYLHGLIKAIGAMLSSLGGADLVYFGCTNPAQCEELFMKLRAHFAFSKTRFQLAAVDRKKVLTDTFTAQMDHPS